MKRELLTSLFVAGLLFSGCQTDSSIKDNDTIKISPISTPTLLQPKLPSAPVVKKREKVADGWYMRTVASATLNEKRYVHKTAGIFGELNDSKDGKDKHDITAFSKATLYVVFPKVQEDETLKNFFSDYHYYDPNDQYNSKRQVWTFQVKNERGADLSNASITLRVEGPYKVYRKKEGIGYTEVAVKDNEMLSRLSLIDLDNKKVYTYSELENADLKMDGKKVRTFRWVLGSVLSEHLESFQVQEIASRELIERRDSLQSVSAKSSSKFGLPPRP
ncbi:hypothetical protein MNB_SV-4-1260 [hydrothermal vent metagenome]|uniref:Lipoprotein n=1 Tax=hydrothermal vent metagenome TaxID=652676 RepID=A0A1W1E855_9ZZZZ